MGYVSFREGKFTKFPIALFRGPYQKKKEPAIQNMCVKLTSETWGKFIVNKNWRKKMGAAEV